MKKKSLTELRLLSQSGAEVLDKDGIGVKFAAKVDKSIANVEPFSYKPEPKPKDEVAASLERFALAVNVLLTNAQAANANMAELVLEMRKELERQAPSPPKPTSWVFDVQRDGNGNMKITASPKP